MVSGVFFTISGQLSAISGQRSESESESESSVRVRVLGQSQSLTNDLPTLLSS